MREGQPPLRRALQWGRPRDACARDLEQLLGVPACALAELRRRRGRYAGAPAAARSLAGWLVTLHYLERDRRTSLPVWSAVGYRLAAEADTPALQLVTDWDFYPLGWLAAVAGLDAGEFAHDALVDPEPLAFLAELRGQAWVAPLLSSIRRRGFVPRPERPAEPSSVPEIAAREEAP